MTGVEPYHRNVAMAFESYALYPQKTVFENLASPLRSGRTGTYAGAAGRADRAGHHHAGHQPPAEALPAGAVQRAAPAGRARAGCWSAPPTSTCSTSRCSHLDAKLRAAMRAELKQLGEMSSTTTLYVTHDYQEALALGDRIGGAARRAGSCRSARRRRSGASRWTRSSPRRWASRRSTCSTPTVEAGLAPGGGDRVRRRRRRRTRDGRGAGRASGRATWRSCTVESPRRAPVGLRGARHGALAERLGRLVELVVRRRRRRSHHGHLQRPRACTRATTVELAADWARGARLRRPAAHGEAPRDGSSGAAPSRRRTAG